MLLFITFHVFSLFGLFIFSVCFFVCSFDFYSQYANIEEHVIRGVDTHSIANHCIGHNLLPQIMNRVIAQL